VASILIAAFLACASVALAQQPSAPPKKADPPVQTKPAASQGDEEATILTLRTQVVVVPFSISDRFNRPINDVRPTDIKLLENGVEQEVVAINRAADVPLELALVMDYSGSMSRRLPLAKRSAARFLERILKLKDDRAAILACQQDVVIAESPTGDLEKLRRALDGVEERLPTPVGRVMPFETGRSKPPGTALYAAIYIAADDVLARPATPDARRVIVVVSDGFDSEGGIRLNEVIERAWRSGIVVYALGIADAADNTSAVNRESLERLCTATGGRAFFPRLDREFYSAFDRIDGDLRQYFTLAYTPNAGGGAFRAIRIETPKHPDWKAHHRSGYYGGEP
jgi:VWFA-related protein